MSRAPPTWCSASASCTPSPPSGPSTAPGSTCDRPDRTDRRVVRGRPDVMPEPGETPPRPASAEPAENGTDPFRRPGAGPSPDVDPVTTALPASGTNGTAGTNGTGTNGPG